MEAKPEISELEIQRFLTDQSARVDWMSPCQKRQASVQRLLSKIQLLTESDFEAAFGTMESIVDGIQLKRGKFSAGERKVTPEKALGLGEAHVSQTKKMSA